MNNQFDPYNNQFDQYNNQFNGNGMQGFGHQQVPYINKRGNDNRGGGFFSFLIAVILLIGCSGLLMHFLGYIDLSEYLPILDKFTEVETNKTESDNKGEETDNKTDSNNDNKQQEGNEPDIKDDSNISSQEKDLKKMCTLMDNKGKYFESSEKACFNKTCILIDSDVYYSYDCETEGFQKVTEDEVSANFDLNVACANVDSSGSYTNSEKGMTCSDYVCTYNFKDISYSMVCNLDE